MTPNAYHNEHLQRKKPSKDEYSLLRIQRRRIRQHGLGVNAHVETYLSACAICRSLYR
jgi:hypothetical protein